MLLPVYNKLKRPKQLKSDNARLTVMFDDGNLNNYTEAYPIMKSLGIPGVEAVVTNWVDASPETHLTTVQCQELWDDGWDIVSHTKTHKNLTTLTETELRTELADSHSFIATNGWYDKVLVSPWGATNDFVTSVIQEYYQYRRATSEEFGNIRDIDPWCLDSIGVLGGGSTLRPPSMIKTWIDHAYRHGLWLTLLFHQIGSNLDGESMWYEIADFQEIMEYASTHPIIKGTYRTILG